MHAAGAMVRELVAGASAAWYHMERNRVCWWHGNGTRGMVGLTWHRVDTDCHAAGHALPIWSISALRTHRLMA